MEPNLSVREIQGGLNSPILRPQVMFLYACSKSLQACLNLQIQSFSPWAKLEFEAIQVGTHFKALD